MSKERFDIAIGILDPTENAIERIKNQHKFEKDLSEFLNTNTYSKDKAWVVGVLNQVSEYCKDKIDILMEKDQRIAELEEQLKNAVVLPKYEKGQPIYYICNNRVIEAYFQRFNVDIDTDVIENPHEVTDDDGFTDIDYDFGLVDYRLIYATKEEAEAKLKELQGEKR